MSGTETVKTLTKSITRKLKTFDVKEQDLKGDSVLIKR